MDEDIKAGGTSGAAVAVGAVLLLANLAGLTFAIQMAHASRVGVDGGYDPLGVTLVSAMAMLFLVGLFLASCLYICLATSMHIGFRLAVMAVILIALCLDGGAILTGGGESPRTKAARELEEKAEAAGFFGAVRSRDSERVDELLSQYPEFVNATTRDSEPEQGSALAIAIHRSDYAMVETLMKHGASHALQGLRRTTSLHYAAERGDLKMTELLITHGADPSAKSEAGWSPLNWAMLHDQKEIVDYLCDVTGETPDYGALLISRCCAGPVDAVAELLDQGVSIETVDEYGVFPLHRAVTCGNLEIAAFLVSRGAKVDRTDQRDNTLLHVAVNENKPLMIQYLIEQGVDVNATNNKRETPLHRAAVRAYQDVPDLEMMIILVEGEASVNVKDKKGQTPLAIVTANLGAPEAVSYLKAVGATE